MERRPSAWESLGFLCFPSHCTTLGGVVAPSCLHLSILWRHNQPSQQSTLGIRVHIITRETPFVCALRPPALPQDSDPLPIVRFWRRHKQPHQTPVNAGQCPNQQPRCVYQCLSLGVSLLFSSILPLPGLARKWSFYSFSFHSIFLTSHFALSILFWISLPRKLGGSVWYQPAMPVNISWTQSDPGNICEAGLWLISVWLVASSTMEWRPKLLQSNWRFPDFALIYFIVVIDIEDILCF